MKKAYCKTCGRELFPCPAKWDGEPTFVGYSPCPNHPSAGAQYEPKTVTVRVVNGGKAEPKTYNDNIYYQEFDEFTDADPGL
jgi:hypothetical protein